MATTEAVTGRQRQRRQILRHNGFAVRALREARDLTQGQLAEMAGIDRASLAHLENETRSSTGRTLGRLARALGVPPAAILRDADAAVSDADEEPAGELVA